MPRAPPPEAPHDLASARQRTPPTQPTGSKRARLENSTSLLSEAPSKVDAGVQQRCICLIALIFGCVPGREAATTGLSSSQGPRSAMAQGRCERVSPAPADAAARGACARAARAPSARDCSRAFRASTGNPPRSDSHPRRTLGPPAFLRAMASGALNARETRPNLAARRRWLRRRSSSSSSWR
jgi:hypothetical protein